MTDKTIAQQISALFNDNGQVFETDESHLYQSCIERASAHDVAAGSQKFIFEDSSSIVLTTDCWDFGVNALEDCHCFDGEQHGMCCCNENCE